MVLEITYPRIEKPDGQPARLKRIPRIRVAQIVMDYLAHGWSPDEMCRQHPYLQPVEAHPAMAYYFEHQKEIEREIDSDWTAAQQAKAEWLRSPFYVRLKARGLL